MLYLDVPTNEYAIVKKLGALWDETKQKWYVLNEKEYLFFGKWILGNLSEVSLLHGFFYIVVGTKKCPNCGKYTTLIAFSSNNHLSFFNNSVEKNNKVIANHYECYIEDDEMKIIPNESLPFSDGVLRLLNKRYNYDFEYSEIKNQRCFFNRCIYCNCKITNLKSDTIPGISVFNLCTLKNTKSLKLFKVSIPYDLNLKTELKLSDSDVLSGAFPRFSNFNQINDDLFLNFYRELEVIQDSFLIVDELNPSKRDIFSNSKITPSLRRVICPKCGGEFKIRNSKYGYFAGCENYPKCRSTIKLTQLIYLFFKQNGFNIYKWKRECWKCGKKTSIYSYYPLYDLGLVYPYFDDFAGMGLGDIPSLDRYLCNKHKNILTGFSHTEQDYYIGNHCDYCGSLQGKYFINEDPHEIHNALYVEYNMSMYLTEHVPYELIKTTQAEINRSFKRLETFYSSER